MNRKVPEDAVPQDMMDYLTSTGPKRTTGNKLLGVMDADEILLYTVSHKSKIIFVITTSNFHQI